MSSLTTAKNQNEPSIEKLEKGLAAPKKKGKFSPAVLIKYMAWQLIALLCVEAVLAAAGLGEEELFAIDPELGMTHMTDKSVTWRKEGYARSYLNWDGLRESNITPAKPAGVYRVALLGDSMVEGLQVPLEQTFGKKLEKQLTAKLHRPVQVINFGTSGYSTVQECLLMKRKVFNYAPDMVLLGYDGRDMFENWSTPDQSLANVRPYALKLPKQKLVIDNSSVTTWMKTPRAKFLTTIGWIRSHSRIWGLISAAETEAGFHNPVYATMIALCTQPGKTIRRLAEQAKDPKVWQTALCDSGKAIVAFAAPSFKIQFFDKPKAKGGELKELAVSSETGPAIKKDLAVSSETGPAIKKDLAVSSETGPAIKKDAPTVSAAEATANKKSADIFLNLMKDTLDGLLVEMQNDCAKHGAVLCVQALPSRATLSPIAGMDATTYGLNYEGEVDALHDICVKENIPYVDGLRPAMAYPKGRQQEMFYSAHMTSLGHDYLAGVLEPFLLAQIEKKLR
ncbi:MAG: SGNH/GDSL hydrolase family protein [Cyanobacteria bacterium REEB67]|nr:SGNH/GDSL hydrolase family protein [Cyanobacteria bacterium REEB67]